MENILEIRNLQKTFADNKFKIDIQGLEIPSGVIVGMIGDNTRGDFKTLKSPRVLSSE